MEKGTLPHCWWECKLVQPLWRTVYKGSLKTKKTQQLKIGLPWWLSGKEYTCLAYAGHEDMELPDPGRAHVPEDK